MNHDKLHEAQASFLLRYPKGFADPAMAPIRKKHNVDKLIEFAQANLARADCARPHQVADALLAIVSRSSMVSRFEKPQFRAFIESLDSHDRAGLAHAVEQRLHGRRQQGFEALVGILSHYKLAKWPVVTAVPFYFAPRREVFIKPTTAKGILRYLEVDDPVYRPAPSWAFYQGYRALIAEVKKNVSPRLAPNNAALTGFLMMQL